MPIGLWKGFWLRFWKSSKMPGLATVVLFCGTGGAIGQGPLAVKGFGPFGLGPERDRLLDLDRIMGAVVVDKASWVVFERFMGGGPSSCGGVSMSEVAGILGCRGRRGFL
jgi:hypothetical protein